MMSNEHECEYPSSTNDHDQQPLSIHSYGWGPLQPKCLQKTLNNAKAFLVFLTLANVMQGVAINGLLKVGVTSIERRFNLLSSESGLIISAYDIAGCLSLLPISYLGGNRHKPRWIGIGILISGIGFLMLALPHFLTEPYDYKVGASGILPTQGKDNFSETMQCNSNLETVTAKSSSDLSKSCMTASILMGPYVPSNQMKYVFIVGQFLTGVGCTPLAVLGVTFIDESVDPQHYPLYIGIYYMGALIGPAIGFILGSQLLNAFTEIPLIPEDISVESPQWVGAWWVGFIVTAFIMFFLAIPILGYPMQLPSMFTRKPTLNNIKGECSDEENHFPAGNQRIRTTTDFRLEISMERSVNKALLQSKKTEDQQLTKKKSISFEGHSVQAAQILVNSYKGNTNGLKISQWTHCKRFHEFFRQLRHVITHKAFMALSMSAAVLGTLVSGFSTFGAKFIESQFGKSASDAANIFAYVMIPAAAGGMLVGAFLMSGLKMEYKSSLRMCFCVSISGLIAQFALTLHCDDINLAGINAPYHKSVNGGDFTSDSLTSMCNAHCICSSHLFDPLCGSNGLTYYSPCYAGCNGFAKGATLTSSHKVFNNCSCITWNLTEQFRATNTGANEAELGGGTPGRCAMFCRWHDFILVGLFVVISTTFLCAIPGVDLSLRCFPQELRSLAIGIQWILIRTLGTIPGPIIFGAMIDSTCQVWSKSDVCSKGPGSCSMYKNQELSFTLLILSGTYKGASILFFGLTMLCYKPAVLAALESPPLARRRSNETSL